MEIFDDLIKYASTWIHVLKNHVKIFKLEAKLARLSFLRFCAVLVIISNLLLTTWLALLFVLGYEIFLYTSSLFITSFFIFIANLIILGMMIVYALYQIKNMQFQASRRAMRLLARKRIKHADTSVEKSNSNSQ